MKRSEIILAIAVAVVLVSPLVQAAEPAPVAGSSLLGVSVMELREVTTGWSARHQLLTQAVFNGKNEKIGTIDDIVIGPDKTASYGIVGVGGFLGMGKHDVAIPVSQFKQVNGKFVLAGATRDALKSMPEFEYAH